MEKTENESLKTKTKINRVETMKTHPNHTTKGNILYLFSLSQKKKNKLEKWTDSHSITHSHPHTNTPIQQTNQPRKNVCYLKNIKPKC